MGNPTQTGLEHQLRQLSQLLESATVSTRRLQQVWQELAEVRQQFTHRQQQLQQQYQSQRDSSTEQQVAAADQRRQQTATRWEQRRRQLQQATHARLSELQMQCDAECESVEQKLQSELWVLQSVCDETQEDTPLSEAARAQENFQTQSVWLDQRLADLEQRIGVSADYLRLCHARADAALPPPVAEAQP